MNEEQYESILEKLNGITKLLALSYVQNLKTQKEKIILLNSLGFSPSEIAYMLDTTSNTVSVALAREKKKK